MQRKKCRISETSPVVLDCFLGKLISDFVKFAFTKLYICDQCSAATFRHTGEVLYIFPFHGRQLDYTTVVNDILICSINSQLNVILVLQINDGVLMFR